MKRFIETSIWGDSWHQELSIKDKLLWRYLLDNCDNAGVWNTNRKLAEFQIGSTIDWDKSLISLTKNIVLLPSGRIWIPPFIMFQFGKLSPDAKIHQHVVRLLYTHGLDEAYSAYIDKKDNWKSLIKSHSNGIAIPWPWAQDKRKRKDKEKEEGDCKGELVILAEANEIYSAYPNKVAKPVAIESIKKAIEKHGYDSVLCATMAYAKAIGSDLRFCPNPSTWFNQERYNDDPATWVRADSSSKANSAAFVKPDPNITIAPIQVVT